MNHAAGENSARVWPPEAMASCREKTLRGCTEIELLPLEIFGNIVSSYQFAVISEGGPHQMEWRTFLYIVLIEKV